ncbi:hypothetical protein H0H87_010739 [Tephrocybe sp. NHM501043]|nr:hypothetical protein H0H87_010739 [Tephrocybe sp. NHM501043]
MSVPGLVRRHRPNYTKALEEEKKRLPTPSHRHAAPSAPWPWIDIHDKIDAQQLESELPPVPELCDHSTCGLTGGCWTGYPQSRFPNWTPSQIERSKIADAISNYNKLAPCKVYHVDVNDSGFFTSAGVAISRENEESETWEAMVHTKRPHNIRVRALFVENMSGPVLQMLGARYNIEPFFFSSSLNWIPSRYQENPEPGKGDHITITLTFLKSMDALYDSKGAQSSTSINTVASTEDRLTLTEQMIDTQSPLRLRSKRRILVLDLLSVHLIRNIEGSTIISYHPTLEHPTTSANWLRDRIRYAGQSVYWQSIFQKSQDPTFVLLTFVWHALYAWDEALEHLYNHICWLETKVITTSDMILTQELHVIRAHHLHYSSLLEDFQKTVNFIKNTYYPGMDSIPKSERKASAALMVRECDNLLSEIDRLEMGRRMQDKRLKNVMNLAVFGMNIKDFVPGTEGTAAHYLEVAIPLTGLTIWVVVAFQSKFIYPEGTGLFKRFAWPVQLCLNLLRTGTSGVANDDIPLSTVPGNSRWHKSND